MWSAKSVRAKTVDPASREATVETAATVETVADATDTVTADPAASALLVKSVLKVVKTKVPHLKVAKTVRIVAEANAAVLEAKTVQHEKTVQHAKTVQLGTIAREPKEIVEEETVEPVDQTVAEAAPEVQTV